MRSERPDFHIIGEILRQNTLTFAVQLDKLNDSENIDINWINRWKSLHEIFYKKRVVKVLICLNNRLMIG